MKTLERILFNACASLTILVLVIITYDAYNRIYADNLLLRSAYEPTFKDAEKMLLRAVRAVPDTHYKDKAGVVYYEIFRMSGDTRAYDNASKLLYASAMQNPYNPEPLIHLIQLDIVAVKIDMLKQPTKRGLWACDAAENLDKNNATIKNLVKELRGKKK